MQTIKTGDRVRIVRIPPNLVDGELGTRSVFEKCRGHVFVVEDVNDGGWLELIVDSVTGDPFETIWIEPEFVELDP